MVRAKRSILRKNPEALSSVIAIILIIGIIAALSASTYLFLYGFVPEDSEPLAATSFTYQFDQQTQSITLDYISGPTIESTFTLMPEDGLVLSLPMDDQATIDTYKIGNPSLTTHSSIPTNSLQVSTNNYLSIPSSEELSLTTSGSISTWIKPSSLSAWSGILHKGHKKSFSDECYSLQTYSNSRQLFFGIFENAYTYKGVFSSTMLQTDTWYHIVATYDSADIRLYINDELDATTSNSIGSPQTSTGSLQIGAQLTETYNSGYQNFPFQGEIGPTYLYNRALSEGEIHGLYSGGSWDDFQITKNGEPVSMEYVSTTAQNNILSPGASITITDPSLKEGDTLQIIYKPANQVLKTIQL